MSLDPLQRARKMVRCSSIHSLPSPSPCCILLFRVIVFTYLLLVRAVHILDVAVQVSQISKHKWNKVNPRFFGFGGGMLHYTLDCEIRAVPGTNDLKFELWYDGENYTNEHSIAITWKKGARTSKHPHEDLDTDRLYNKRLF